MKDLLLTLALIAGALVMIAAAVFGANDRQLFVPPPDAVAEAFVRQLTTRRYDLATKYLGAALRHTVGERALRSLYEPLQTTFGTIDQVDAELQSIDGDRARARASLRGEHGSAWMPMRFTREHGLWVVSELPDWTTARRPDQWSRRRRQRRREVRYLAESGGRGCPGDVLASKACRAAAEGRGAPGTLRPGRASRAADSESRCLASRLI